MVKPPMADRVYLYTNCIIDHVFTGGHDWMSVMYIGNTTCSTQGEPAMPETYHPALTPNLLTAIDEAGDHLEEGNASGRVAAAQAMILAAIGLLDEVARETKDRNARAYIIDHLQVLAGGDHEILSRDDNLDRWQCRLRKREGLDPEDFPEE
jgi:hypothetical protein